MVRNWAYKLAERLRLNEKNIFSILLSGILMLIVGVISLVRNGLLFFFIVENMSVISEYEKINYSKMVTLAIITTAVLFILFALTVIAENRNIDKEIFSEKPEHKLEQTHGFYDED